ncbi:MAG TPA: hypothetical protein VMC07_01225 [Candidatus Omnitrophota bacterium]|nr:hypothetical protein [Candidatus Omnitrophota bacterium]
MKKGAVFGIILVFLFLTGFVSAQNYFSDLFANVDPTLITLGILFVVIFALLNFTLSKTFSGNPTLTIVLSSSVSLLAVYWINNVVSLGNIFSGLGISNDLLYTIGPILFIGLVIFLLIKIRFGIFLVLGAIMILASVTGLVPSTDIILIIGIAFAIIGFFGSFSKTGRLRSLLAKYRKIQRRNPADPRLRILLYKMNQLKPGIGQMKT